MNLEGLEISKAWYSKLITYIVLVPTILFFTLFSLFFWVAVGSDLTGRIVRDLTKQAKLLVKDLKEINRKEKEKVNG